MVDTRTMAIPDWFVVYFCNQSLSGAKNPQSGLVWRWFYKLVTSLWDPGHRQMATQHVQCEREAAD